MDIEQQIELWFATDGATYPGQEVRELLADAQAEIERLVAKLDDARHILLTVQEMRAAQWARSTQGSWRTDLRQQAARLQRAVDGHISAFFEAGGDDE